MADLKYGEYLDGLTKRDWDADKIRAALDRLRQNGFGPKEVDLAALNQNREEVLARVRRRGEEYEYLTHSCSRGSALAVMEEFGLGSWDVFRSMSPFPGFGMTGGVCGAVTGSLVALGLYFGSDDPEDFEAIGRTMTAARTFIERFQEKLGTTMCPGVQEQAIFGKYMDPRGSAENFETFKNSHGYEKCSLPPGLGAVIATEIILDSE